MNSDGLGGVGSLGCRERIAIIAQDYEHVYSQEAEYIKKLKVTIKYNNNNTSNNTIHVKNKT